MSTDTFVREARSGIRRLNDGLLEIESEPDQRTVDDLFRTAHSLKSSLDMEGYDRASELAHALEDLLEALRSGDVSPDGRVIDRALAGTDSLEAMVDEIDRHGEPETDPTAEIEALRRVAGEDTGRSGFDRPSGDGPGSATTRVDDDAGSADTEEMDPEVQSALDAASEFDDLDSLLEDVEEPDETETLEGGGSLDDVFGEADETETPEGDGSLDGIFEEADETETPEGDGSLDDVFEEETAAETSVETDTPEHATDSGEPDTPFDETSSGSAQDPFIWAKSTVDEDASLDELQREIEAESFGEFDEEDDMTIEELLAVGSEETEPTTDAEGDAGNASASDAGLADERDSDESGEALQAVVDALASQETADPDAGGQVEATADAVSEGTTPGSETQEADAIEHGGRAWNRTSGLEAGDDAETDVSTFGSGGELSAFQSRFDSLFESEDGTTPATAAPTIEETALSGERFRRQTEREPRTATGTSQVVQSLTVDVETADDLLSLAEDFSVETRRLADRVESDAAGESADELASLVRDLQRTVMDIRLMPIEAVTNRLDRVVRDTVRNTETRAEVTVQGAGVRVDRSIIDKLRDPLVHLVRNAADHGIEPVARREAAGKPPVGEIAVRAQRHGDEVEITVSDDGRGIDADELRREAVREGILDRTEAATLGDAEAYDLVFHPGLSTTEEVTDTSGRGVGMDVVHEMVTALDGQVTVESGDSGTTVRLEIPVNKAVSEVVVVAAGDAEFAIPMAKVNRIGRGDGGRLTDGLLETGVDRTVDLAAEMGIESADTAAREQAVVSVETTGGAVGVVCDRIVDRLEAVITPYDEVLADVPGVSGATAGTDGQLVHVIDVEAL